MDHLERFDCMALRHTMSRSVAQSSGPVVVVAANALYEAASHNYRPVQLDKLFRAQLLEQRVHRCMKQPAGALRVDTRVIAFRQDFIDHRMLNPFELVTATNPKSVLVLAPANEALADKTLLAAGDNSRHEPPKRFPPAIEPPQVWRRYLGDEIEVACSLY